MSTTTITLAERFVCAGSCGNRFAAMPQSRHARFAGARLAALRPAVAGEYERRRERRHFFLFQGIIINDIAPTSCSPTPRLFVLSQFFFCWRRARRRPHDARRWQKTRRTVARSSMQQSPQW
jgi:hypothetical protein